MYSTRPTSKYEMYVPWWTMPIRSVSPNRTRTTWRDTQWAGSSFVTGARDNTSEPTAKQSSPCRLRSLRALSQAGRNARTRPVEPLLTGMECGFSRFFWQRLSQLRPRAGTVRTGTGDKRTSFSAMLQEQVSKAGAAMGAENDQIMLSLLQFREQGRGGLTRDQPAAGGERGWQGELTQKLGHVVLGIFADQLADRLVRFTRTLHHHRVGQIRRTVPDVYDVERGAEAERELCAVGQSRLGILGIVDRNHDAPDAHGAHPTRLRAALKPPAKALRP